MPTGLFTQRCDGLERAGFLASEWATVGGRKRRTYRLTDSGRAELAGERTAWTSFTSVIGKVLNLQT